MLSGGIQTPFLFHFLPQKMVVWFFPNYSQMCHYLLSSLILQWNLSKVKIWYVVCLLWTFQWLPAAFKKKEVINLLVLLTSVSPFCLASPYLPLPIIPGDSSKHSCPCLSCYCSPCPESSCLLCTWPPATSMLAPMSPHLLPGKPTSVHAPRSGLGDLSRVLIEFYHPELGVLVFLTMSITKIWGIWKQDSSGINLCIVGGLWLCLIIIGIKHLLYEWTRASFKE